MDWSCFVIWKFSPFYLDLIVLFGKASQQPAHRRCTQSFLAISKHKHDNQLQECKFSLHIIDFFNIVVKKEHLKIALHKTDSIHRLKAPTSLTNLRSTFRIWNVFWRFVRNFAQVVAASFGLWEKAAYRLYVPWKHLTPCHEGNKKCVVTTTRIVAVLVPRKQNAWWRCIERLNWMYLTTNTIGRYKQTSSVSVGPITWCCKPIWHDPTRVSCNLMRHPTSMFIHRRKKI